MNGVINGLDIQSFVDCLLTPDPDLSDAANRACINGDTNFDGHVKVDDIPCYVGIMLGTTAGCYTCESGGLEYGLVDCNSNEVVDANDIAGGTSEDCNNNGIPDECDIAEETSADVNSNDIPDECEGDCNGNDIPDSKDIADEISTDIDEDGTPDECEVDCNGNDTPDDYDIAESISTDCNENNIPDECEDDCNNNDVPDDCDIDPTDPDGDEWVSEDCNENGVPDECDLARGAGFGSLDCNDNDIPDECDIASEYSDDENENGIPDECEEQQFGGGQSMMMGGEGGESESPCSGLSEDECWEVFWEWSFEQCWGSGCELNGSEQYQALIDKLGELGLPIEGLMH